MADHPGRNVFTARVLMPCTKRHKHGELICVLKSILEEMGALVVGNGSGKQELLEVQPVIQQPFENKVCQCIFKVYLPEDTRRKFFDAALNFASLWCMTKRVGLHDQFRLEILNQSFYFIGVIPYHYSQLQGYSLGSFLSAGVFCEHYRWEGAVYAHFEHDQGQLCLIYDVTQHTTTDHASVRYQIMVHYSSIENLVVDYGDNHGSTVVLLLQLKHPPMVSVKHMHARKNGGGGAAHNNGHEASFKRTGIAYHCSREILGKSDVLKLVVPTSMDIDVADCTEVINRLKDRSRVRLFYAAIASAPFLESNFTITTGFLDQFDCEYALQALLSRGYYVEDQMSSTFLHFVYVCSKKNWRATLKTLEDLVAAIDQHKDVSLVYSFLELFRLHCLEANHRAGVSTQMSISSCSSSDGGDTDYIGEDNDIEVPKNCVKIRKVVVTPTRQILMASDTMMANRVVRRFGAQFALRVLFRDDSGLKWYVPGFLPGEFDEAVSRTLLDGIRIGNKHYRFLAWSNSQLRDNGCYMYCTTDRGETVDDIRRWMGDFASLTSVPKLMARMGQCFTQAQAALTIPFKSKMVREESDVVGGLDVTAKNNADRSYVFSDGVGRISLTMAKDVAEKLGIDPVPSAFQIRYAGYKGMLSVDPRLDATDDSHMVVFRQSMRKFATDSSDTLEIVKHSQPSPVALNRPLIMIIDQITSQESTVSNQRLRSRVHRMLQQQIFEMSDMLLHEEVSVSVLTERVPLKIGFRELRNAGFSLTTEPLFRDMLLSIHQHNLTQLLSKLKIEVDPSLGRTMFGILDETGLLFPEQVFVQYSKDLSKPGVDTVVVTGRVMVTKNPSVVPGDVRILTAVDVQQLHHLVDVIVFPRYGMRPLPDQMAGSDLDGDEYAIYWDPELMFEKNHQPMHFPKAKPIASPRNMTVEDMIDFFKQFVSLDSVGRVATAHLITADRLGISHPLSMSIAAKLSMAVDFPKTGIPPDPLTDDERPFMYPDYLQRHFQPSYCSHWLLGDLYRRVKLSSEILQVGQLQDRGTPMAVMDLATEGWEVYVEDAIFYYNWYTQHLTSLMERHDIASEAALISGHFLSLKNRICDNEKEDFSYFNTEKIISLQLSNIFQKYRKIFFADFNGETEELLRSPSLDVQMKASAWYVVAYNWPKYGSGPMMLSFPWVVWEVLCYIKMMKTFSSGGLDFTVDPVINAFEEALFRLPTDDRSAVELQPYLQMLEKVEHRNAVVRAYLRFYGDDLRCVLLALLRWSKRQSVHGSALSLLKPFSVLFIFFYFMLNIVSDTLVFPYDAIKAELRHNPSFACQPLSRKGQILLSFFKFAASEQFRSMTEMSLPDMDAPLIFFDRNRKLCFSNLAFKTYQHVALTGSVDHFRSSDTSLTSSNDPASDLSEMNPVRVALNLQLTYEAKGEAEYLLQQWSGVKEIYIRSIRFDVPIYAVSAYGSLEARQRLERILLSPDLDKGLQTKECPEDI